MSTQRSKDRIQALKKEILKWEALNRIAKTQDYQEYLKPILEQAQINKWPDPVQENFSKIYRVEYGRALAFKEIQNILETAEAMIINLTKQINDPDKNYEI